MKHTIEQVLGRIVDLNKQAALPIEMWTRLPDGSNVTNEGHVYLSGSPDNGYCLKRMNRGALDDDMLYGYCYLDEMYGFVEGAIWASYGIAASGL